jgi:hypothetical protein
VVLSAESVTLVRSDQAYTILVYAEAECCQPVGVEIPRSPTWAHDSVAQSLHIWNESQQWFRRSYYPSGSVFTFNQSAGQVEVRFENYSGKYYGWAETRGNSWVVHLVIGGVQITADALVSISLHEFGHVMGLFHSQVYGDLMYETALIMPASGPLLPSTMDLYALHELAGGYGAGTITLPNSIPYVVVSYATLPEFYSFAFPLFILTFACLFFAGRARRQRPNRKYRENRII